MNNETMQALSAVIRPDSALKDELRRKVGALQNEPEKKSSLSRRVLAAAAAFLVLCGAAFALRYAATKPQTQPTDTSAPTTAEPLVTIPVNPDGSVNYNSLASDGAALPSIVKSGQLSDIAGFREEMVRACDLCFEGTVIDVQHKQYDYRYYYGEKFGEEAYIHEQPVTQLTTFRIEKVWHGDPSLVGTTATLEDEGGGENGTFGYRKDVCYVVLVQDVTGRDIWQPDDDEQRLVEGDVARSSPYMTYYPFQPQVEKTKTGDYIVPTAWETMTADSEVKVTLNAETPFSGWSRYDYEMYADGLRLVKANMFRERMKALLTEKAAQPVTIPYNPDGSVNYSDLTVDGAALPSICQSSSTLSIMSFFESFVQSCDLCFEGTVIDVRQKQYDFRYYYGVKFGEETYIHEQPVTQLTTFRIEKVWHGDPSLVGTTITLEDETGGGSDGVFGYRKDVCYVVLMRDITGWDIWHPVGEERLVEGDITRSSPYATYYPWQPQVEIAKTGDYIVPTAWETMTADSEITVVFDPETPVSGLSSGEFEWFKDQLRLVKKDVFHARMEALLQQESAQ